MKKKLTGKARKEVAEKLSSYNSVQLGIYSLAQQLDRLHKELWRIIVEHVPASKGKNAAINHETLEVSWNDDDKQL